MNRFILLEWSFTIEEPNQLFKIKFKALISQSIFHRQNAFIYITSIQKPNNASSGSKKGAEHPKKENDIIHR